MERSHSGTVPACGWAPAAVRSSTLTSFSASVALLAASSCATSDPVGASGSSSEVQGSGASNGGAGGEETTIGGAATGGVSAAGGAGATGGDGNGSSMGGGGAGGMAATCGDGTCQPTEDCETCFEDCGICPCLPDALEPNGTSGTATPLTLGVPYCDLSVCTGDVDWFEVSISNGFVATVTFFQAQGDLDLEIYSEATLGYVTGAYSMTDDEVLTVSGLTPGAYWARVYGAMGAENPDYCVQIDSL